MPTVLVTGFEVFGPHARNPTREAVGLLPDVLDGVRVVTGVLPVEYGRCGEVALGLVGAHSPDAVILTGLAAGRSAVTPERVAVNLRDTGGAEGFADNSGYAPEGVPIVAGGPGGIFATLPNHRIVEALLAAGIPAEISDSAGTYICNETLYAVLASLAAAPAPRPLAGFVHVPDVDVMPLESIVRALHVTIGVVGKAVGTR